MKLLRGVFFFTCHLSLYASEHTLDLKDLVYEEHEIDSAFFPKTTDHKIFNAWLEEIADQKDPITNPPTEKKQSRKRILSDDEESTQKEKISSPKRLFYANKKKTDDGECRFCCEYCNDTFKAVSLLMKHLKKFHK